MDTTHIKRLLDQVSAIVKKHNAILDKTGARFNVFKLCRVDHYETTHSKIIAELLDRNGSHGLKTAFLDTFLEELQKEEGSKSFNFDSKTATVRTELNAGGLGRIDILVEDAKGKTLLIENKIHAGDGNEQLKRYKSFLSDINNLPSDKYTILYLTLHGHEASEQSSGGVKYTRISYATFIVRWLKKCVHIAAKRPFVRESLKQYINHINSLAGNNPYKKMNAEIIESILSNKDQWDAYQAVHAIPHANFIDAILFRLCKQLSKVAKKIGMEVEIPQDNILPKQSENKYILFRNKSMMNENIDIGLGFDDNEIYIFYIGFLYSSKGRGSSKNIKLVKNIGAQFKQKYPSAEIRDDDQWFCWDYSVNWEITKGMDWKDINISKTMHPDQLSQCFKEEIREMVQIFEKAKEASAKAS